MPEQPLNIGLVIPESGPSGIFGPSCRASAELAIAEINQLGGGSSVEKWSGPRSTGESIRW